MFGIIRPCRHRLGEELKAAWLAHLCGTCLSLRDDHGQAARLATNYDGLVISVLAEAQADGAPARRAAGRCALRGMRKADVAAGDCARLAATVSLVLAAAKLHDHADDGDGLAGRRAVRSVATGLAARWAAAAQRTGREIGFEVGLLTEAVGRQAAVEAAAGPGTPLLTVTEPTETATGAAFAHTAVLARKPGNAEALAEAGRLFGRSAPARRGRGPAGRRRQRHVEPPSRHRHGPHRGAPAMRRRAARPAARAERGRFHRGPAGARAARARGGPLRPADLRRGDGNPRELTSPAR